jgi:hypothetical protein
VVNPQGLALSPDGLILFALLCGGDYDPGIDNCGVITAFGLARCGFGDKLVDAIQNLHDHDLDHFLVQWRDSLQFELSSNSQGMLCKCQPQLALHIPDTFPK